MQKKTSLSPKVQGAARKEPSAALRFAPPLDMLLWRTCAFDILFRPLPEEILPALFSEFGDWNIFRREHQEYLIVKHVNLFRLGQRRDNPRLAGRRNLCCFVSCSLQIIIQTRRSETVSYPD